MKNLLKSFWFNVILILGICAILYFAFFASLSKMTLHGKSTKVPNIMGQNIGTTVKQLEQLGFKVDIDSIFDPTKKPQEIVDVQPEQGATVKFGRTIFLIYNKAFPPEVIMPNLVNMSLRSAQLLIESNKLILGDTIFKPDMAKGAVLAQLSNGQPIAAGKKIFQGTKIDLVIGDGFSNTSINVPNLINMPYKEAIALLNSQNIFITEVWDGTIADSNTAVVYFQMPTARNEQGGQNSMLQGENLDIRIRQQPLELGTEAKEENTQ